MLSRFRLKYLTRSPAQRSVNGHSAPPIAELPKPVDPTSILDCYFKTAPSAQNAIDIFAGEWASKFPPPYDHLSAGGIPVFQDSRLVWAINQLGGVYGQNILELGPLEGAHAYILERSGAAAITAIEANSHAYLKCLITREILNLARTRFLCGDFVPYLENSTEKFDCIVASGVLYHMKDPLHLLKLIAGHTDRLYIWTHYFDEKIIADKPYLQGRFQTQNQVMVGESAVVEYRQDYLNSLQANGYSGGSEQYSTWLSHEGMMVALREYGFTDFAFGYEMPDHPHGPAMSLVAVRKRSPVVLPMPEGVIQ